MAYLFAAIALLAIVALVMLAASSGSSNKHSRHQHTPGDQHTRANPTSSHGDKEKTDHGAGAEEGKNYWERFVGFVETREKFIVATSTIFIALFTVILAFATGFLYLATKDLVTDARENAERQLRAYIAVKPTGLTWDMVGAPIAVLKIENTGLTPAYEARIVEAKTGIFPQPLPKDFVFPVSEGNMAPDASVMTIHSHQSFDTTGVRRDATSDDEYADVSAGRKTVYVYGTIKYKDAFGIDRFSEFCAFTPKEAFQGVRKGQERKGEAAWRFTDIHNRSD